MECIHSAKLARDLRVDHRMPRVGLRAFNSPLGRALLFGTVYTFVRLAAAVPTFIARILSCLTLSETHLRRLLATP